MNLVNIKNIPPRRFVYVLLGFLLIPLLIIIIYVSFVFPWSGVFNKELCYSIKCIENSSEKYLKPFSWYSSWLVVLYNVTTILGVAIAVLTYYSNVQSQAISNHFSNVDLFKNYVEEEISKRDWLSVASFDLMVWYLAIYPNSKKGDMKCSSRYRKLINEINETIRRSNQGVYDEKIVGYRFVKHQKLSNSLYKQIGIKIKETNRLSYYEVEGQLLDLIESVNSSFPSEDGIKKFIKRSYK